MSVSRSHLAHADEEGNEAGVDALRSASDGREESSSPLLLVAAPDLQYHKTEYSLIPLAVFLTGPSRSSHLVLSSLRDPRLGPRLPATLGRQVSHHLRRPSRQQWPRYLARGNLTDYPAAASFGPAALLELRHQGPVLIAIRFKSVSLESDIGEHGGSLPPSWGGCSSPADKGPGRSGASGDTRSGNGGFHYGDSGGSGGEAGSEGRPPYGSPGGCAGSGPGGYGGNGGRGRGNSRCSGVHGGGTSGGRGRGGGRS